MAETGAARSGEFLEFIRRSARELRNGEALPKTLDHWKDLRTTVRKNLVQAIGLSTDKPGPVPVRKIREQKRDGYRIEHLVLRTIRTGDGWIEMPANAYVPDGPGRRPARWRSSSSAARAAAAGRAAVARARPC